MNAAQAQQFMSQLQASGWLCHNDFLQRSAVQAMSWGAVQFSIL